MPPIPTLHDILPLLRPNGARWASDWEVYREGAFKAGNPGFVLDPERKRALNWERSMRHVIELGGTGEMKTSGAIMASILAQKEASIVCMDPSDEIYHETAMAKARDGYKILCIKLSDLFRSLRHNFIAYTGKDPKKLSKLLNDLIVVELGIPKGNDKYWHINAKKVLTNAMNLLLTTPEEYHNLGNLNLITSLMRPANRFRELNGLASRLSPQKYQKWLSFISQSERVLEYHISTAQACLEPFELEENCRLTSHSDFSFEELRDPDQPAILYISVNETEVQENRLFLSLFFSQLFDFALNNRFKKKRVSMTEEKPIRKLMVFFEEAGSIPIRNLPKIVSTARKREIALFLVIQDKSQLIDIYHENGNTIFSGCKTRLYFGDPDVDMAKKISDSLGKKEDKTMRQMIPLYEVNEIIRMTDTIMQTRGLYPIKFKMMPFFKVRKYRRKATPSPLFGIFPTEEEKFRYLDFKDFPELSPTAITEADIIDPEQERSEVSPALFLKPQMESARNQGLSHLAHVPASV
ncbi:MAG: type IV secretory system conjugative DNA transfer family protein [Magnetococcales bacterium]|nr:type IV secretory system conjugative DNA transfer family protein [Magnetococcales bacterium]